jgi:hypothetical protein
MNREPASRGPRARGYGREDAGAEGREEQYDLLTAAILGAAIGAGATLLVRAMTPRRKRVRLPAAIAMMGGRELASGAKTARKAGRRGSEWVREQAESVADGLAPRKLERQLHRYLRNARRTIDDTVASELHDLRRALRRQRRRLGL